MFTNANIKLINYRILAISLDEVLKMEAEIKSGKMTRAEVDETRYQLGIIRSLLDGKEPGHRLSILASFVSKLIAGDFVKQQSLILANDLGVVMFDHVMVTGMASKDQLLQFFDLCRKHKELVENKISKDDPI